MSPLASSPNEMDTWYWEAGTHIVCKTCFGTDVSGVVIAYDIGSKLLFLKRTSHTQVPTANIQSAQTPTSIKNSKNARKFVPSSPLVNENDAPIFQSTSNAALTKGGPGPYVLLNMRYISTISEVCDKDSLNTAALVSRSAKLLAEHSNTSKLSTQVDAKAKLNTAAHKYSDTDPLKELTEEERSLVKSLTPPVQLDIDMLKGRLNTQREQKFKEAELAKLGVTRDGLEIINLLKQQMPNKRGNVVWDKDGNILVFDEVTVVAPYTTETVELINDEYFTTLMQAKNIIAKYYKDKQCNLAATWVPSSYQGDGTQYSDVDDSENYYKPRGDSKRGLVEEECRL